MTLLRVKPHQLEVYEKKHPTENIVGQQPGDEKSVRQYNRELRRAKSKKKLDEIRAEREKTLPLHRRTGVLGHGEEMADMFDDPDQSPGHFHPEAED